MRAEVLDARSFGDEAAWLALHPLDCFWRALQQQRVAELEAHAAQALADDAPIPAHCDYGRVEAVAKIGREQRSADEVGVRPDDDLQQPDLVRQFISLLQALLGRNRQPAVVADRQ